MDSLGKGRSHTHKRRGKMIVLPRFYRVSIASLENGRFMSQFWVLTAAAQFCAILSYNICFLTQRNLKSCAAFFFLIPVLLRQLRSDLLTQFKLHFPDLLFCFRISVDSFLCLDFPCFLWTFRFLHFNQSLVFIASLQSELLISSKAFITIFRSKFRENLRLPLATLFL